MGEQAQAAFLGEFDVESDIEDDSEATDSNSGGESKYEHNDDVVQFTDDNDSSEDDDWEPSFIEFIYS